MPGGNQGNQENQVQQERQNRVEEQRENAPEQVQQERQMFDPDIIETGQLNAQDQEIIWKIKFAAKNLETDHRLPNLKAFNDYMMKRINQDWVQKSDEYAKVSANLYRKYENAYLDDDLESNWEKLEREAEKALRKVQQRDEAARQLRKNAHIKAMEQTIDELLADRKERTDSPAYTAVWKAADKYKKTPNSSLAEWKEQVQALKDLLSALQSYASLRYRKRYGTFKGRRRMDRVTKLIAQTGSILEVEPSVTAIRESAEKRNAIDQDLKRNFSEKLKNLDRANGNQLSGRWADILLPYERNAYGEVTEETRAAYEDNWETIEAFQTQDDELRLTMIAKLYQRLNKLELSEKSYEKDNINAFYKNATKSKGLFSLYMTFSIVLQMEKKRYKNREMPAELTYMSSIMDSEKYVYVRNGTKSYLEAYGFKEEGGVVDVSVDERKNSDYQSTAKIIMDNARTMKDPDIDPDMEQALRNRVDQFHQQQGYQDGLRRDLQDWLQKVPESQNYVDDTARVIRENKIRISATQDDLLLHHSEYFDGGKIEEKGWEKFVNIPTRLRDMMLIYKRGEDGKITPETRGNYEKNMKLLKLCFSKDATDRIAVIAYFYLNLKKTRYAREEDLTSANLIKKFREEHESYPLQITAYNVVQDAITAEKGKTKNNELLSYMDEQTGSANMSFMRQLGELSFCLKGYNIDGTEVKEEEKDAKMASNQFQFDAIKEVTIEKMQEERNKNNGQVILPVAEKEEKLRKLCRSKGLM